MAYGLFLNFEKLSINIIENEIVLMSDDIVIQVFEDIYGIDERKFENNLYHGSIVATFIVNLYETTLNTILSRRLNCTDINILKESHTKKLNRICKHFNVDAETIKKDSLYHSVKEIIKLRNDITHYKCNEVACGHFIGAETMVNYGTSGDSLATMFTKKYMKDHYNDVINLLELLCDKCNLTLCKDCLVIDCDGRDSNFEFVLEKRL